MMSWNYNPEFAVSVAAASYAIYSIQEAEAEDNNIKINQEFGRSKSKITSRNEDASTGSVRVVRHSSIKDTGESSIRAEMDRRGQVSAVPSRKPSRSASMRPLISVDQTRGSNGVENKVDSWELAQLRKINKRYEKVKAEIVAWENARKIEAKIRMEKKKNELELRKSRNSQHYQLKISSIESISSGAKRQLEEKRRNEETEVKEKAKHMRSKGKNPVSCFCC